MDQPSKVIETKTSPFSLPKSTINSIQNKNIKKMKYATGNDNKFFYIFIGAFAVIVVGIIVYVIIALSRLQSLSSNDNLIPAITSYATVQVSDTETIKETPWAPREIKINNNVVWNLQLPSTFIETTIGAADGTNIFTGDDNGQSYKLILAFPLFANYPGGEPADLKTWIQKELTFLKPDDSLAVTSESFTVNNNINATLLSNMNEITVDSGNARIFGTKKSLVLYISKTKTRNFSKITLIPQGTYSEQTAHAMISRIASSIKF